MKLLILLFLCVITTASSVDPNVEEKWEEFKLKYQKAYEARSKDEIIRKKIFTKNYEDIEEHNKRYAAGQENYVKGINQFSDLTYEEFAERYLTREDEIPEIFKNESKEADDFKQRLVTPESYSWSGVQVPIKNQGQCGSCWAFATIASIEYRYKRFYNKAYTLSEQELVDCETRSFGCNGGYYQLALTYIRDKGISFNQNYPYTARRGSCNANAQNRSPAKIINVRYTSANEVSYKDHFFQNGPIIVSYFVDNNFYQYRGGIFSSSTCNSVNPRTNHAVLVVGYGIANNVKYWLIRNSWGTRFGENGYFRILRDAKMCNLGYYSAYYPDVK